MISWTKLILLFTLCLGQILGQNYRTITGFGNNLIEPSWGSAQSAFLRLAKANYSDNYSKICNDCNANPREVSNAIFSQPYYKYNKEGYSDFVWLFGQYLENDMGLMKIGNTELMEVEIPTRDLYFLPGSKIAMYRAESMIGTGESSQREFVNQTTSYIDGSAIYGSNEKIANWLRSKNDGKLRVSDGNFLPWNTINGEFNLPIDSEVGWMFDKINTNKKLYVAGDPRANENQNLLTLHTIFVREHNRLCDELIAENSSLSDEDIYQLARRKVIAFIQKITYKDWLPLLGINLVDYRGYSEKVNSSISNEFASAASLFTHTIKSSQILRLDETGNVVKNGNLNMSESFFEPLEILKAGGIEPYIRGMASQKEQTFDVSIDNDLRNNMSYPNVIGNRADMVVMDIMHGRDVGLPSFNVLRKSLGLPVYESIDELNFDPVVINQLKSVYKDVNLIDAWVGLLAERPLSNSMVGKTLQFILRNQFTSLRDGDRFYYENDKTISSTEIDEIENTSLKDIIMRNSDIKVLQNNVFFAKKTSDLPVNTVSEKEDLSSVLIPNPLSNSKIELKVYALYSGDVEMFVHNINGQKIANFYANLKTGYNFVDLNISNSLSSGIYFITLARNTVQTKTFKIIKINN